MPDHIYEVVAQGARYWFLFLMALIVWRSFRWYRRDRRQAKKRRKLLPDAGYVGEMIVLAGGKGLPKGTALPVPNEGTLGAGRTNDICLPLPGVEKKHLWFVFEEKKGLRVAGFSHNAFTLDGKSFQGKAEDCYMAHGSCLAVGEGEVRLRLFAGFESTGYAQRVQLPEEPEDPAPQPDAQAAAYAAMQQWMQQQWQMQQQAYEQGYRQAMQQQQQPPAWEAAPDEAFDEDELPFDMAQIAQAEGLVDHSLYMRPSGVPAPVPVMPEAPEAAEETVIEELPPFYPPVEDEDDGGFFDEDMTDAAAPPKSAYVGHDEAARAKAQVWDKYFGGGRKA